MTDAKTELLQRADQYLNSGSSEYASEIMRDMAKYLRGIPALAAGPQEPSTFDDDPVVIELREVKRIVSDDRVSDEAIGMRLRNTLAATNALSMLASLKQRIDQLVAGAPDRDAVTRIINGIYGIGAGTYAGGHQDKSISRAVDSILKLYQSAPGAGTVTSAQGARQPCGCGVMCQDLGKEAGCRYMQPARRDLRKLVDLVYKHAADCVPMTLTADKLIDEVFGPVEPSEMTEGMRGRPDDLLELKEAARSLIDEIASSGTHMRWKRLARAIEGDGA